MSKQYKVVFSGKLQQEAVLNEVIENISLLFKLSHEKATGLIATKTSKVIKKDITLETAKKYEKKLAQAGLHVDIEEIDEDVRPTEKSNNNKQNHKSNTINESTVPVKTKRPTLVWVISLIFIFGTVIKTLGYLMVYSGIMPLNEAQTAQIQSSTTIHHLLSWSSVISKFFGAVLLLALRRYAFHLFMFNLFLGILTIIYQILFFDWLANLTTLSIMHFFKYFIIIIPIILYTRSLSKKGILK